MLVVAIAFPAVIFLQYNVNDVTTVEATESLYLLACLLPHSMLMQDRFPSRLRPFVSEVAIKDTHRQVGNNARSRLPARARRGANIRSKVWNIKEVESEVDTAVRMAIAAEDDSALDQDSSLMEMGLDSLGSVELSRSLQQAIDQCHVRVHPQIGVIGGRDR